MAEFRKGAAAVAAAAASKSSRKYAPIFKFDPGEKRYIQFITPMDEVITVLMHQWIIVGNREDGSPVFERFISRRDPTLDGVDGYDEIIERFGLNPTERSMALAAEVEPVYSSASGRKKIDGFDLVYRQYENRDGDTVTVPNIQLILESPRTFFNTLSEYNESSPITEVIYEVKRLGGGRDTAYVFIPKDDFPALDIEEELDNFEFDFEAWLEDLSDEDRMHELIGPIPDGTKISKFGDKKGKDDEEEEKPKTRARRTRAKAQDEEPEENEEPEEEEQEKKSSPDRSRRFQGLRETVNKK